MCLTFLIDEIQCFSVHFRNFCDLFNIFKQFFNKIEDFTKSILDRLIKFSEDVGIG